jgi:WD40 repeat protein
VVLLGHTGAVQTVSVSPDSWRAVSSGDDGAVRVWDLGGAGTPGRDGHAAACAGVAYGPYGELLVSCGHDGVFRRWDGREGLPDKDGEGQDAEPRRPGESAWQPARRGRRPHAQARARARRVNLVYIVN